MADGVGLVFPVLEGVASVVDVLEGLLRPGFSVGYWVRFRLSAPHHVELLPQPYFHVLLDLRRSEYGMFASLCCTRRHGIYCASDADVVFLEFYCLVRCFPFLFPLNVFIAIRFLHFPTAFLVMIVDSSMMRFFSESDLNCSFYTTT